MKCPVCKEKGLKSSVTKGHTMTTLAGTVTRTDEAGVTHRHDRNVNTTSYKCSQGHFWETGTYKACSGCGWRNSEDWIRISEEEDCFFPDEK